MEDFIYTFFLSAIVTLLLCMTKDRQSLQALMVEACRCSIKDDGKGDAEMAGAYMRTLPAPSGLFKPMSLGI